MLSRFCEDHGIGVWMLEPKKGFGDVPPSSLLREQLAPSLLRRADVAVLLDALRPEHKAELAGTNHGGYWTPCKETLREVSAFVASHPGSTLREVVESVKSHYANKRTFSQSIPWMLKKGLLKGVEMRRDGKALRLYPVEVS